MRATVRIVLLVASCLAFSWGVWMLTIGIIAFDRIVREPDRAMGTPAQIQPELPTREDRTPGIKELLVPSRSLSSGAVIFTDQYLAMTMVMFLATPAFASFSFAILCWIGYCVTGHAGSSSPVTSSPPRPAPRVSPDSIAALQSMTG